MKRKFTKNPQLLNIHAYHSMPYLIFPEKKIKTTKILSFTGFYSFEQNKCRIHFYHRFHLFWKKIFNKWLNSEKYCIKKKKFWKTVVGKFFIFYQKTTCAHKLEDESVCCYIDTILEFIFYYSMYYVVLNFIRLSNVSWVCMMQHAIVKPFIFSLNCVWYAWSNITNVASKSTINTQLTCITI